MREFVITDAADQQFTAILGNRRCTIRMRFNVTVNRWMLDLSVDETTVVMGRRLVLNRDALAGLGLGLGSLFLSDLGSGAEPGRDELPSGAVRLFYAAPSELAAAA